MSHGTETVGGMGLTNTEQQLLIHLLKHPNVKKMVDDVKESLKKEEDNK